MGGLDERRRPRDFFRLGFASEIDRGAGVAVVRHPNTLSSPTEDGIDFARRGNALAIIYETTRRVFIRSGTPKNNPPADSKPGFGNPSSEPQPNPEIKGELQSAP